MVWSIRYSKFKNEKKNKDNEVIKLHINYLFNVNYLKQNYTDELKKRSNTKQGPKKPS